MLDQNEELVQIISKFAECGWDVIDVPSRSWLEVMDDEELLIPATSELITAVEKADAACGTCGCEFDPLYKRALELLRA